MKQFQNNKYYRLEDERPPIPNFRNKENAIFCDVCKKWLSSLDQYQNHVTGRKHTFLVDSLQFKEWKHENNPLAFGRLSFHQQFTLLQKLIISERNINNNARIKTENPNHLDKNEENVIERILLFLVWRISNDHANLPIDKFVSQQKKSTSNKSDAGIILYYQYTPIPDPNVIREWQLRLCHALQLTGRIRIAHEGINGTVGGMPLALELYKIAMKRNTIFDFKGRDFKTGLGAGGASSFPYLLVQICKEIVTLGLNPQALQPDIKSSHLFPQKFHSIVEEQLHGKRNDVVLIDCRNYYESDVGKFRNAITPQTRHFSDFPDHANRLIQDMELSKKTVLMYCTGGIRCERGAAYLRSKGVNNVFQLDGGIHKYLEQFPDGGYWDGKLFVFDRRINLSCANNKQVISNCSLCNAPWDQYDSKKRCSNCLVLVLCCMNCSTKNFNKQLFCRQCNKSS